MAVQPTSGPVISIVGTFNVGTMLVGQTGVPAVAVGGVPSAGSFGAVTIHAADQIGTGGVPSAQAFGTPLAWTPLRAVVSGVPSAQDFGTRFSFKLGVQGVPSAQAFGQPDVYIVWLRPITPITDVDITLQPAACSDLTLVAAGQYDFTLAAAVCSDVELDAADDTDITLQPAGCT